VVAFFAMWILAERGDRWLLIALAGCQLLTALTCLTPDPFVGSSVAVRRALWLLISVILFVGAWEGRADRRYRLGEAHNAKDPEFR